MYWPIRLCAVWLFLLAPISSAVQNFGGSSDALIGSRRDANTPQANATVWIGGCTGTLIRPDMIVTAGHCTNRIGPASNYRDNVWYPVGNLENGRWADIRFGVDRLNPIATATATHFAVYSPADIALFLLSQRVPREVATPASVLLNASGIDWRQQSFRQVGWGNTVALTGSSTPRFRQTSNATFRQYPCYDGTKFCVNGATAGPGDSGGPLYWTDRTGREWIIGEAQGDFGVGARYIALFRDGVNDFLRFNLSTSRCSLIEYSRRILDRGFVRLVSWYSDGRGDNVATTEAVWQGCTTADRRSPDYAFVRVEGKIFHPDARQPPGTIPLFRWYSSSRGDN